MNRSKGNNSEEGKGGPRVIYVVDDEPMLLELATAILKPMGYDVETFRSAEAALEAFVAARTYPSLIITDYAMHLMSGLALIEECRRVFPRQKTLLVSGTVDEQVYRHSRCKPDRFLAKPYQAKQLVEVVRALLPDGVE
jgi:DNA-binding NtrC family response regulator